MAVRPVPTEGPINLGILYPTVWFGDPDALKQEIETVQAIDPRISVIVETYDEPHELRTERGRIAIPVDGGVDSEARQVIRTAFDNHFEHRYLRGPVRRWIGSTSPGYGTATDRRTSWFVLLTFGCSPFY